MTDLWHFLYFNTKINHLRINVCCNVQNDSNTITPPDITHTPLRISIMMIAVTDTPIMSYCIKYELILLLLLSGYFFSI